MLKIDKKTVIPFIYIVIVLIGIDIITTFMGIGFGSLEENNMISLMLMKRYGDFFGLLISFFGKIMLILFPMLFYKMVSGTIERESSETFNDTFKNTYFVLYMVAIIASITATFVADINNIILIMNRV